MKQTVKQVEVFDMSNLNFVPDPDLIGQSIRVMDAHRKYGIPHNTISQWADAGIVKVIERAPKLLLLEESSVAKASAIFKYARDRTTPRKAAWILKRAVV